MSSHRSSLLGAMIGLSSDIKYLPEEEENIINPSDVELVPLSALLKRCNFFD